MTPSKITAWLDCPHYLTLHGQVETGELENPRPVWGSFVRLVADKGILHERACLEDYRRHRKSILEVSDRREHELFSDWVARVGNPLDLDYDVLSQMPFIHDGIRAIADFVVRLQDAETGAVTHEPVDAKLTRIEAKPGHVLQLCFYADAIEALTAKPPEKMHIWLGSGDLESLRVNEFRAYWRRIRIQLARALEVGVDATTVPRPCPHCPFSEFNAICEERWRSEDSLIYVAGIRQLDIATLVGADLATLTHLANATDPVDGIRPERLARLVGQAALQLQARADLDAPPPFSIVTSTDEDSPWGHGLEEL